MRVETLSVDLGGSDPALCAAVIQEKINDHLRGLLGSPEWTGGRVDVQITPMNLQYEVDAVSVYHERSTYNMVDRWVLVTFVIRPDDSIWTRNVHDDIGPIPARPLA